MGTNQGQGSVSNVICALASFFICGLGQLLQGRAMAALGFFLSVLICGCLYFLIIPPIIGFGIYIWAIVDAALFVPKNKQ